jgi:hypothetical protein
MRVSLFVRCFIAVHVGLMALVGGVACGESGSVADGGAMKKPDASGAAGRMGHAGHAADAGDGLLQSSAEVNGDIEGKQLIPKSALVGYTGGFVFVHTTVKTRHHLAVITDFADHCGNGDVVGGVLYFDFFQNASLADSHVTQPGTFSLWAPKINGEPTPTDNRVAVSYSETLQDGSGGGFRALTGTVTVTEVTDAVLSATFDVAFESTTLTGSFKAPICNEWARDSSIPTYGP